MRVSLANWRKKKTFNEHHVGVMTFLYHHSFNKFYNPIPSKIACIVRYTSFTKGQLFDKKWYWTMIIQSKLHFHAFILQMSMGNAIRLQTLLKKKTIQMLKIMLKKLLIIMMKMK